METRGDTCVHTRAPDGVAEVIILYPEARPRTRPWRSFLAATLLGAEQVATGCGGLGAGAWQVGSSPHTRLLSAHQPQTNVYNWLLSY